MPRFTFHLPAPAASQQIPTGLQTDSRMQIVGELPRMVLIECAEPVAEEWLAKMPGWVLKPEQKAKVPDPRPKLQKRLK